MERLGSSPPLREIQDTELVSKLQVAETDGQCVDDAVVREMILRCKPEIDIMLRSRGIEWHDLDELEQIVFIQILRKIHDLKDPNRFHAWVRTIARRMAINFRMRSDQRSDRRPMSMTNAEGIDRDIRGKPADNPLIQLMQGEQQEQLIAALAQMKEFDRNRLRDFYLLGISLNEIVKRDSIPLGTLKRQLHTARQRLLKLFEKLN